MKDATQINTAIPMVVLPRDGAPSARYLLAELRRVYPFYGAQEGVEDEDRFDAMDRAGHYWEIDSRFDPDALTADLIKSEDDYGNRASIWLVFRGKETKKVMWRFRCEVPIDWISLDSTLMARLYVVEGEVTMFSTLPLLAHGEEATWKTTRID